jgi:hypothetical protein
MSEFLNGIITKNPRDVGVPHDKWYDNQYAALEIVQRMIRSVGGDRRFLFLEMPTGSGKSGVATALGHDEQVTVLVGNLNLLHQYRDDYKFDIIEGKSNYDCTLERKVAKWAEHGTKPTAADCSYSPMKKCENAAKCPYLIAKETGLASNRLAITYKYAFLSYLIREREGILIADECHEIVEEILGFATFRMSASELARDDMPPIPYDTYMTKDGGLIEPGSAIVIDRWLKGCIDALGNKISRQGEMFETYNPDKMKYKRAEPVAILPVAAFLPNYGLS